MEGNIINQVKINEIEASKNNGKDQRTKSWFSEKINIFDKTHAKKRTQINKIRNEEKWQLRPQRYTGNRTY